MIIERTHWDIYSQGKDSGNMGGMKKSLVHEKENSVIYTNPKVGLY